MEKRRNKSKVIAQVILGLSTALTTYALYLGLEGAAMAFWSTGIPSCVGLYANKQYQDRKYKELEQQ